MTSRAIRTSRGALVLGFITTSDGLLGFFVPLPVWTGIVTICSVAGCAFSVAAPAQLPEGKSSRFLLRRGAVLLNLMLCLWPWILFVTAIR